MIYVLKSKCIYFILYRLFSFAYRTILIFRYTQSKHLVRHKRSHKQQYCNYCEKTFSNISEHLKRAHDIDIPRPFECDICMRTYRTKSNLQAHMKIHVASKIFECNLCPKKFFYATDLRKHLRTHSQERSVICDICGDSFKSGEYSNHAKNLYYHNLLFSLCYLNKLIDQLIPSGAIYAVTQVSGRINVLTQIVHVHLPPRIHSKYIFALTQERDRSTVMSVRNGTNHTDPL